MLGYKTFHTYMIHILSFYMILTPSPLPVTVPFSILNLINNTILHDTSGKCFEIFLLYWYLIYGLRRELLFDSIINNWPGKLRLFIKIDKCLSVAFKPSTKFLPWYSYPTPRKMKIIYACANIDSKYNTVSYLYCSAKIYISTYIVLIFSQRSFRSFKNVMISLLCAAIFSASSFL